MKKMSFLLGTTFLLASCGGSDPAKDAREVCDCYTKANGMNTDDPKRKDEQDKCLKLQTEHWDKYKNDLEKANAYNAAMADCSKKMIEESLK